MERVLCVSLARLLRLEEIVLRAGHTSRWEVVEEAEVGVVRRQIEDWPPCYSVALVRQLIRILVVEAPEVVAAGEAEVQHLK